MSPFQEETDPTRERSESDDAVPQATRRLPSLSRRSFVAASAALCGTALTRGVASAHAYVPDSAAERDDEVPKGIRTLVYAPLPLGSVKARGWLLRQLELQRDGLTGHAEELLPATRPNSAWKGGDGEDWEKGPYYLKGLVPLAYTLGDEKLKRRAQAWIDPILSSQREDGFYGPKNDDWWPRMVVNYLLRDYHEATGDPRVLPFLTRYYRYMEKGLPSRPLKEWGKARAGDEIDTVLWLHERTHDEFLLGLTDLLAAQAYPWTEIFQENRFLEYGEDYHPKHNVNVPQALKMPAVYSRRSGDRRDREAYRAGVAHLMRDHGTSFGIASGTEKLSGRSTVAGVETCSIVEYMLSAETALRVLGDARIGDELERVAFNGLPAAMSKDFRQHVYYTLPNNVVATRRSVGYEQGYDDARTPAPRSGYPCCCYNLHMGWPKLAQNAWGATRDGGLAALVYVPSEVVAQVAGGKKVKVECDTEYPFEEVVRLRVSLNGEAKFPMHLRVPGWCQRPQVLVNGKAQKVKAGRFAVLDRRWKDGDRVELRFPMPALTTPQTNGWVSVERGPLVYALGLDERWKPFEKREGGFDSYEVTSDSPWNFALVPDMGFEPVRGPGGANPFETGKAPVAIRAKARRLAPWGLRPDGLLSLDPPPSPVSADGPLETLTLVPFGSQMLRVSVFPVVGAPKPAAVAWKEDFAAGWQERLLVFGGGAAHDGALRLERAAKAIAPRTDFHDVAFEAEVTVGAKGDAGLLFRATAPSVGVDHYRGYYVGLDAERGRVLFGKSDGAWTQLESRPLAIRAGVPHRVRVEARGTRVRVWVDDAQAPALEAEDVSFSHGSVGVRSYSDSASFARLSALPAVPSD